MEGERAAGEEDVDWNLHLLELQRAKNECADSLGRGPLLEASEAKEVGKRRRVRGRQKMSSDTSSCVSGKGRIAPG